MVSGSLSLARRHGIAHTAGMNPDSVAAALRAACAREPDVEAACLFGSFARGEAGPQSDIDVAVLARRGLSLADELGLRRRLAEAIGAPDVDLVLLGGASPLLRREATTGRQVFERDAAAADAYERRVAMEYFDTQHSRRVQQDLLFEAVRRMRRGPPA